ncbi:MAG: hypothetical protein VCD00_21135 [Candidatus Hydrogenedentota bacterium]
MSEAVRSFSRRGSGGATGGGTAPRGSFLFTRFVIAALILFAIISFWISRDTHRIQQFIERDPASLVVAQHLLQNRDELFTSPSWNALSDSVQSHPVPSVLTTPLSAPDWVLRNLIGQYVLITTQGTTDFEEAIYITRMSRVGVLLERGLRRRSSNISEDSGGLGLRYLSESGLYYAVRGRVLLLSASRHGLVHTLTLSDTERIPDEEWDESIWALGDDEFRGTFRFSKESRWEPHFARIDFALRLRDGDGTLELRAACTDVFYEELIPQLDGQKPSPLIRPMPGPIEFSANLGTTFYDLSQLMETVLGPKPDSDEPWLVGFLKKSDRRQASYLDPLIDVAGPSIAQTWHGYELGDLMPTHKTSIIADYRGTGIQDALVVATEAQREGTFKPLQVSRDTESDWLEIETVGGLALTAILGQGKESSADQYLFASTSKQLAEQFGWGERRTADTLKESGNLYVRINPGAVLSEYEAYSAALQSIGAISEVERSERESRILTWRERMKGIHELALVAHHENREITATLFLRNAF